VYPQEVEQVLGQHPDIADAAVVGVPDALYGEAVAAFVQPRPGAQLSAESVIEHCRAQLAGYKKPRHVIFVDALPRNSLGKVLKSELRKNFLHISSQRDKVPGAKLK
jgi:long-chain acyl-CoA synthetase